jgi:hypothetical protein
MRYRIGEDPTKLGGHVSEPMLTLAAVLGLMMGMVFVYWGWHGRQMWLLLWGSGLVVASIIYIVAVLLGFI